MLLLLAETLMATQHSMNRSIDEQLERMIKSDITQQQREIFRELRREPQFLQWIKTTSV